LSSTDTRNLSELRKFGFIVGSILIALGAFPVLKGKEISFFLLVPGILFFITALACPSLLMPINRIWMKVGHLLGRINSFIILSIIFYIIFTPMRVLITIVSKEKKFAFKTEKGSNWIKRKKENYKETMKRQF
jgi:hypothetical protein